MAVTIKDVAAAAGVSPSTVSRTCKDSPSISRETKERVRRIMARDNITEQYARLRISAQKPDEFYRGKCDLELNNGAETAEVFQQETKVFFARLVESLREEKRNGNK